MYKVLHADAQRMFCEGLQAIIHRGSHGRYEIVGAVHRGDHLCQAISELHPDIVLLDLELPITDGMKLIGPIKAAFPELRVVFLTHYRDPEHIRSVMKSGADGYVLKERLSEELIVALDEVMTGRVHIDSRISMVKSTEVSALRIDDALSLRYALTPRETEILGLIARSKTNKDIGELLYISDQTVSVHRKNLMKKLRVSNTAALINKALRYDLITEIDS